MHISVHIWQFVHFLNLLNHLSLCQEIFLTFFPFLSTLGVFWSLFSTHTKSWVFYASHSPHASTLPFLVFCQKFQEQFHPSPIFSVDFNHALMFCLVSMPFSRSYFSSRSSKEFLKCWGWLNESQEQVLLKPEQGLKKEPCVCNIS